MKRYTRRGRDFSDFLSANKLRILYGKGSSSQSSSSGSSKSSSSGSSKSSSSGSSTGAAGCCGYCASTPTTLNLACYFGTSGSSANDIVTITFGSAFTDDIDLYDEPCGGIELLPKDIIVNITGNCSCLNYATLATLAMTSDGPAYVMTDYLNECGTKTKFSIVFKEGKWVLAPEKNHCVFYSAMPPYYENCDPFELRFGPFPVVEPCCTGNNYALVQVVAAP